jgi:hypothetical protein
VGLDPISGHSHGSTDSDLNLKRISGLCDMGYFIRLGTHSLIPYKGDV